MTQLVIEKETFQQELTQEKFLSVAKIAVMLREEIIGEMAIYTGRTSEVFINIREIL